MVSSSSLIWMFRFFESTMLPVFKMFIDPNSMDVPISGGQYITAGPLCSCNRKKAEQKERNTIYYKIATGRERLIRSHPSARFCFELSGNSN